MVQPTYVAALRELKAAPAPEDQLKLLRLLKNDIVGHAQRKELAVRHGLLDPLAHVLLSTTKSNGKKATTDHAFMDNSVALTLDHDIRMQATLIVGSLANAGPAFVSPILASNILPPLLQPLHSSNLSLKIVVATLRTLNNLASAWADLNFASPAATDTSLADQILTKPTVQGLLAILQNYRLASSSSLQQQQLALVADLVANCCVSDALRNVMVRDGILDALADILASFATYTAQSISSTTTPSVEAHSSITNVLNALSQIVQGSNYRTHRLIYSPELRSIFSTPKEQTSYQDLQGPNFNQHRPATEAVSVDSLLPKVMIQKSAFASTSFPPLALTNSRLLPDYSAIESPPPSPLCPWLIHLSRSQSLASSRLAALRLLALVSNSLDADAGGSRPELVPRFKERERQIALLAVPIAVKLVKDTANDVYEQSCDQAEAMSLKSMACAVLARLIKNNVELQKAAHNADAHKYVAQILRRSFDPIALARPMWSPQSQAPELLSETSPSTTLGDGGLPREIVHAMKCRAGALEAVAAISEREDTIRKDLIESGVATYIIDSLTPFPESTSSLASTSSVKDGNTVPVILAACHAATAMSRSVGNLRTSLIDAGLGKPIFALLTHSNNDVQVAATDVSINLVLDFSPMREVSLTRHVVLNYPLLT